MKTTIGLAVVAWILVSLGAENAAHAATRSLYYASAAVGPVDNSGLSIYYGQWPGVRFQVSSPISITAVGGHITPSPTGNRKLFAALVALDGPADYPDSTNLSTPDVLSITTFTPSGADYVPSDMIIPIAPTTAQPGYYGLIFGSGLFGATGEGGMCLSNPLNGTPSFFHYTDSPSQWGEAGQDEIRFTVYAAPEPSGIALMSAIGLVLLRRRNRKHE